jgi:glycine dehydrogenase subunit 2
LKGVSVPYDIGQPRKHEFVLSFSELTRDTKIRALNVAKALLDYGIHAPTIYFPLTVEEAFMVEPTESETKRELDFFARALRQIISDSYNKPKKILFAPKNTSVSKIDEAKGSHPKTLCLSWRMKKVAKKI